MAFISPVFHLLRTWASHAASPSVFLPSDFLGCTSLAGTRGLARSHAGEHPPSLSQAAKWGWCWGEDGTTSMSQGGRPMPGSSITQGHGKSHLLIYIIFFLPSNN